MAERREHLITVSVIAGALLAAVAIRVVFIGYPVGYDESFTYLSYGIRSFDHITSTYDYPNNHVFYSLLVHAVWLVVGDHTWTVRVPALLAGIATVPAVFVAARELYSREAAIWAVALTVPFGPLVAYSASGRGYSLGVLLIVLLIPTGCSLLRGAGAASWVGFVACSALAVYTVPTMAYGVATVMLWVVLVVALPPLRQRGLLGPLAVAIAAAVALTVLLYVPLLGQPGWTVDSPLTPNYHNLHELVGSTWVAWNVAAPHPFDWLMLAGAILGLVLHRRLARHAIPLVAAAVAILVVVAFTPISGATRQWLYLAPIYLMSAGAGLAWVFGRLMPARTVLVNAAAAAVVATALTIAVLRVDRTSLDAPPTAPSDVAAFVRTHLAAGERLVVQKAYPISAPIALYLRLAHFRPPMFAGLNGSTRAANLLVLMAGRPSAASVLRYVIVTSPTRITGGNSTVIARLPYITAYRVHVFG